MEQEEIAEVSLVGFVNPSIKALQFVPRLQVREALSKSRDTKLVIALDKEEKEEREDNKEEKGEKDDKQEEGEKAEKDKEEEEKKKRKAARRTVQVSRALLSGVSPVFLSLCQHSPGPDLLIVRKDEEEIKLLKRIIKYIHTQIAGWIYAPNKHQRDIIAALAHEYQLPYVLAILGNKHIEEMKDELEVWFTRALQYDCEDFTALCVRVLSAYYNEIMADDNKRRWLQLNLPLDIWYKILFADLIYENEPIILERIEQFAVDLVNAGDKEACHRMLERLVPLLRFTFVPATRTLQFVNLLEHHNLFSGSDKLSRVIVEAMKYYSMPLVSLRYITRRPRMRCLEQPRWDRRTSNALINFTEDGLTAYTTSLRDPPENEKEVRMRTIHNFGVHASSLVKPYMEVRITQCIGNHWLGVVFESPTVGAGDIERPMHDCTTAMLIDAQGSQAWSLGGRVETRLQSWSVGDRIGVLLQWRTELVSPDSDAPPGTPMKQIQVPDRVRWFLNDRPYTSVPVYQSLVKSNPTFKWYLCAYVPHHLSHALSLIPFARSPLAS